MHKKQHNQTMAIFDPKTAQLPQCMLNQPAWVNWRYKQVRGKPTKMPYNAALRRAASTRNPATWHTYKQCCSYLDKDTGIGFVFVPPFIGIDMDYCVENGELNLLAREVLAKFPHTYAEISPSGHGIHLIVHGTFPWEHGQKSLIGEIYSAGRYFTVTGNKIENAPSLVQHVSEAELRWLEAKFKRKTLHAYTKGAGVDGHTAHDDVYKDRTPLGTDTALYDALCAGNPNWEPTWNRSRKLEGVKGDQSPSAYEMSLARIAVQEKVDKQDIYRLLVGWCIDQRLPLKHHGALVSTIENAHKEWEDAQEEKALDDLDTIDPPDRLTIVRKFVHLPIVRLVQMGRGEAHYRAHLSTGDVLDFGNYAGFKNAEKWEKYVWEYAGKHLFTEKKRWAKICRLLLTLCDFEESEEIGSHAETRAWLDSYIKDLTYHPATADTLKNLAPFVDSTGQYVQLDAFRSYARIHCQSPPITRSAMMGRLRVLGWAEVKLVRIDERDDKRTITRNYWHKAP